MSISIFDNDSEESAASPSSARESAHLVQFYEADSFLLEALSRLIGDSLIADAIKRALEKSESRHVCVYGEMVALLFAEGKGDALLRLEELWNALGKELPFSLCCGYPFKQFSNRPDEPLFLKICAEHSHVVPAESYTELANPDDRLRSITYLQNKVQMLES